MRGKIQCARLLAVDLAHTRAEPQHEVPFEHVCAAAQLLLAETAFESGDIDSIGEQLEGVTPGSLDRDDILDFWRKPKPASYA